MTKLQEKRFDRIQAYLKLRSWIKTNCFGFMVLSDIFFDHNAIYFAGNLSKDAYYDIKRISGPQLTKLYHNLRKTDKSFESFIESLEEG